MSTSLHINPEFECGTPRPEPMPGLDQQQQLLHQHQQQQQQQPGPVPRSLGHPGPPPKRPASLAEPGRSGLRRAVLAAIWCLLCITCCASYASTMHPDAAHLFSLYFQPLIPPIFMLWLWAHNVKGFEDKQIPYEECFSARDRKLLPHSTDVTMLALAATTIVLTWACLFAWAAASGFHSLAEHVPILLYCSLTILLTLPLNVLARSSRLFLLQTVQRVLLPLQAVSWADFLLADLLTSLAKSSGDAAQALCSMATGPSLQHLLKPGFQPSSLCSPLSTLPLAAICLPYAIRFIQCLIVFRTTGNKAQLINALKYCSSFPALLLTTMEHESHVHGRPFPHFNAWIASALFNSAFSYYWDVEMDWDMPWLAAGSAQQQQQQHPQHLHRVLTPVPPSPLSTPRRWSRKLLVLAKSWLPSLRPRVLFPVPWYAWACLSNLALRLAWTHRLLGNLEANVAVTMAVALLEVFRRYQWVFIRVETELRKLKLSSAGLHNGPSLAEPLGLQEAKDGSAGGNVVYAHAVLAPRPSASSDGVHLIKHALAGQQANGTAGLAGHRSDAAFKIVA